MSSDDNFKTASTQHDSSRKAFYTAIDVNVSEDEEMNIEQDYETGAEMFTDTDAVTNDDIDTEDYITDNEDNNSKSKSLTSTIISKNETKSNSITDKELVDETDTIVKEEIEDFTLIVSLILILLIDL